MRSAPTLTLLVAACALSLCPNSHAVVRGALPPLSPDDVKMTAEPNAPGASAIILYRSVARDDNDATEENLYRIKVLTEQGRNKANVELHFIKGQHIRELKARVIQPNGVTQEFNGEVFEKKILVENGLTILAKTFTLPNVVVGSIIEYGYLFDGNRGAYDSEWNLSGDLFTRQAHFYLKPDRSANLTYLSKLPPGASQPVNDKGHSITLDIRNVPAFVTEEMTPPESELRYRVQFLYNDTSAIITNANFFWYMVAERLSQQSTLMSEKAAMEKIVSSIVQPNDNPLVKAKKIYARIQQMRNTSYEEEKTARDKAHSKDKDWNTYADIYNHGYGDGDHLTILYFFLVKAAGVNAQLLKIPYRYNQFFNPDLMQIGDLKTYVVSLQIGGKNYFVDPGTTMTPFGLLPWPESGVKGLAAEKEKAPIWVTTSVARPSEALIRRNATLKLSAEDQSLEGEVTVSYSGVEALTRRLNELHEDDAAKKELLEGDLKKTLPAASSVELVKQPDWKATDDALVAVFKVKIPDMATNAGKRIMISQGLFGAEAKSLFTHETRQWPIYENHPVAVIDESVIDLPEGYAIANLPEAVVNNQQILRYGLQTDAPAASRLHIKRQFVADFVVLDKDVYPTVHDFYNKVRATDEQQIVLSAN